MSEPIVATAGEAARLGEDPALVLEPLAEFLDAAGLGEGELTAEPVGDGHSNLSFLLRRGGERFVLRRPPRGDLAPSANAVLREAEVLAALGTTAVPVPRVLAKCDDRDVIGAPFFVMEFIEGRAINLRASGDLRRPGGGGAGRGRNGRRPGRAPRGRPRRLGPRRLRQAERLPRAPARALPACCSGTTRRGRWRRLDSIADWLEANRPDSAETTFVHGDYRLGNLMFSAPPTTLRAVLDWEMATVGDPLADLGYCTATWADPGDEENPMLALSGATREAFPDRAWIVARYVAVTGRSVEALPWYQVLALWKAAIFLEGSFRRYREGKSADPYFAGLDQGVPAMARAALHLIAAQG